MAGIAYSIGGQWLRRLPVIGPYAAGIITVVPYMSTLALVIRIANGEAIFAPLQVADVTAIGITSLLFGVAVGQALFTEAGLR